MIRDRFNEIIINDISKAQVPCYLLFDVRDDMCEMDILFPSNHNIHKSTCGLCFMASVPLIERL